MRPPPAHTGTEAVWRKGGLSMAWKRWGLGWLTALAVAAGSVCPVWAAPGWEPFADFRIDAAAMDFPQKPVAVQLYRPGEDTEFQPDMRVEWTCTLNRVTGDASFYIQPRTEGVWVTVDCFTDLDGDGVHEQWEGVRSPIAPQPDSILRLSGSPETLEMNHSYVLEAQALVQWGEDAVQHESLPLSQEETAGRPLYVVGLHRGEDEPEQTYYLKIFDSVLIPEDVSPSDWYYEAVEFVLSQGYLTGTGDGSFSPEQSLSRAQLAQILWRVGGSLAAPEVRFSDVGPQDWYCAAVSWCCQEGLMSGASEETFGANSPLTREQLALILFQYVHRNQTLPQAASVPRERFSDWEDISPWAIRSADWAEEGGLLSCDAEGAFHPDSGVTRADMAVVLLHLSQLIELR